MATEIVCLTRAAWLDRRREGITASEIPVILGLSPWLSPFSLYWQKVAGYEEPDDARKARGRRLERLICDDFQDAHSDLVTVIPNAPYQPTREQRAAGHTGPYAVMYAHDDRTWQLATPDCLASPTGAPNQVIPVELKTAAGRHGWGPTGSDEMPVHYRAQVLWQMDVLDADRGYLAVWLGFDDYREYVINRDDDDIATMRAAGEAFLKRIQAGEAPSIDSMASTTATLRQLHPHLSDEITEVDDVLADSYDRTRALVTRAKAHQKLIENKIRQRMGRAHKAVDSQGRTVATRVIYTRKAHHVAESTVDSLHSGGKR